MQRMRRRLWSITLAALALAVAATTLAACGRSSSSTTLTQSASADPSSGTIAAPGTTAPSTPGTAPSTPGTAPSAPGAAAGPHTGRLGAFRDCMQKQGVMLGQHKPGQPGSGAPFQLPAGVTRAEYEAALQRCAALRPRFPGGAGRFRSPAFTAVLVRFGACMRDSGVPLPTPNTTGKGPVFTTTGINTASPTFREAEAKCAPLLRPGFSRPGAGGPSAQGGPTG